MNTLLSDFDNYLFDVAKNLHTEKETVIDGYKNGEHYESLIYDVCHQAFLQDKTVMAAISLINDARLSQIINTEVQKNEKNVYKRVYLALNNNKDYKQLPLAKRQNILRYAFNLAESKLYSWGAIEGLLLNTISNYDQQTSVMIY